MQLSDIVLSDFDCLESVTLIYCYSLSIKEFKKLLKKLKYLNVECGVDINWLENDQSNIDESPMETLMLDENQFNLIFSNTSAFDCIMFNNLQKLHVSFCSNVDSARLCSIAKKCPQLRKLHFSYCYFSLPTKLPEEIFRLDLQELHLIGCEGLNSYSVLQFLINFQLRKFNCSETFIAKELSMNVQSYIATLCSGHNIRSSLESLAITFYNDDNEIDQFWFKYFEQQNFMRNLTELTITDCLMHFDYLFNIFHATFEKLKLLTLESINFKYIMYLKDMYNLEKLTLNVCLKFRFVQLLQQISYLKNIKEITVCTLPPEDEEEQFKGGVDFFPSTIVSLENLNIKNSELKNILVNDFFQFLQLNFLNKFNLNLYNANFKTKSDIDLLKQVILNCKFKKSLKSLYMKDFLLDDFSFFHEFFFDPLIFKEISEFSLADCITEISSSESIKNQIQSIMQNDPISVSMLFKF